MANLSNYPGGFRGGVLVKEHPLFDLVDGNTFWVDSGSGSAGNPGTFQRPLDTIAGAVAKCTANNGDRIYVKSGHSEALASAGALDVSKAGVTIMGVGHGGDMAQIRFTAAAADLDISAASVRFVNMRFTAAFADVTAAIDVDASNTEFHGCKFDEEATNENYVVVMDIADGVDDFVAIDCVYRGGDAANDHWLDFKGSHTGTVLVGNMCFHNAAQATGEPFIESTTQQENIVMIDNYFHSESTDASQILAVDLQGTTNNGLVRDNNISVVDTDATAANALATFSVTGCHSVNNKFTAGSDDGHGIETFTTVEDLT